MTHEQNFLFSNRRPNDPDWRSKWDEALAQQTCTNGINVCIEHYSKDDYFEHKSGFKLKKFAVPSIFLQSKDAKVVEVVQFAHEVDVDVDETSNQIIHETCDNDNPTLCNRCEELKNEMESLSQIIRTQSDEIKLLRAENNRFKQSKLAVFSQNSSSAKVRSFIHHRRAYNVNLISDLRTFNSFSSCI